MLRFLIPPVNGNSDATWGEQPEACTLCGEVRACIASDRDRRGNPLRTVLCYGCGLIRQSPLPSFDGQKQYYSGQYRLEYRGTPQPSPRHLFRNSHAACERLPWLRQALLSPGPVLDVGSGSGEFLRLLTRLGYEAAGIEPDPNYAAFARDKLQVPVYTGVLEETSLPERHFACVTSFHVIEHVPDPAAFLARLRTLVRPGGRLVLETPDVESPFPRGRRRFHRAHLHFFSLDTLIRCAAAAGWKTLEWGRSWDGGNLFLVAEESDSIAPASDGPLGPAALRRFRAAMRASSYYGSPLFLPRLGRQLAARMREWRAAKASDPEQILLRAITLHRDSVSTLR